MDGFCYDCDKFFMHFLNFCLTQFLQEAEVVVKFTVIRWAVSELLILLNLIRVCAWFL